MLTRRLCPVLVGRTSELSELDQLLAEVATPPPAGGTRVALVTGEAGIGKSRLINEFVDRLDRSATVLFGSANEGDADTPFSLLRDALANHVASWDGTIPAALQRREDVLRHLLAPLLPGDGWPADRPLAAEALEQVGLELLRHVVGDGVAVIVFEDLHWADAESVALLGRLAQDTSRLLVVGTFRQEDFDRRNPVGHELTDIERQHAVMHLTVGRLTRFEVTEMLEATFGRPVSQDIAVAVHSRTQGNPFFIEELLEGVSTSDPADLVNAELPWNATEAVLRRVDDLGPDCRRVLDASAILGARIPFDVLAAVTGLDEAHLIDHLRHLVTRGLLGETEPDVFVFRHALTREAVSGQLLGRQRRRLHEAALDALETSGSADHAAMAEHAAGAGRWEELVEHARLGAKRHLREGATAQAHRLARTGLAEAPDDLGLLAIATRAAWMVGATKEGMEHANDWERAAADAVSLVERARALRWRSQFHADAGRNDDARADVEAALGYAEQTDQRKVQASVLATMARVIMVSRQAPQDAVAYADRALALAEELKMPLLRADVLVTKGTSLTDLPDRESEGMELLAQARKEAEHADNMVPLSRALHNTIYNLLDRSEPAHAWPLIHESWEIANTHGLDMVAGDVALNAVLLGLQEADRPVVDKWMRRGKRATAGIGGVATGFRAVEVSLKAEDGDTDLDADLAALEPSAGKLEASMWFLATKAQVEAQVTARVPDAEALRSMLGTHELWETRTRDRHFIDGVCHVANYALIAAVAPSEVRAFLDRVIPEEQRSSGFVATRLAWIDAFIARAEGDFARAEHAADTALNGAVRPTGKFTPGITGTRRIAELELLKAECRAEQGDMAAARALADGAIKRLARWPGWRRDQAKALRSRLGGGDVAAGVIPTDGAVTLTPRERQVIELLAKGYTNGQAAEALFVSTKTVSTHVSNILAKTGSRTRAEAAAWAVRHQYTSAE